MNFIIIYLIGLLITMLIIERQKKEQHLLQKLFIGITWPAFWIFYILVWFWIIKYKMENK